ncbi:hypothetical protein ACF07V_35665 [Streptomyces sp. NPDC015661]|uniref:hypothetical protein n=1 Tax=Streptomyces sp. NPDC015661 TaxID=3364961 RepID=UPI003701894D
MFVLAWGMFATVFGWVIATDFRGAARRMHAMSSASTPTGSGAPRLPVGFLRFVAGVFALAGPAVLVAGVLLVRRGAEMPGTLPAPPLGWVVVEALAVVSFLWGAWRSSGRLRREWGAGKGARRAAAVGYSTGAVAAVVTHSAGWGAWMMTSMLAGELCWLFLLMEDGPGQGD